VHTNQSLWQWHTNRNVVPNERLSAVQKSEKDILFCMKIPGI
jgi:hypothetical protein